MSGFLAHRRWRDLFIYQYLLPAVTLVVLGGLVGVLVNKIWESMLYFVVDGEFILISVLVVISTHLELSAKLNKNIRPFSALDLWMVFVVVGCFAYAANKFYVILYSGYALSQNINPYIWMFFVVNIVYILCTPFYCYFSARNLVTP